MHNLIVVRNHSASIPDPQAREWADACRKQAWYHVAPLWGLQRIPVMFLGATEPTPPGAWEISLFEHADQQGALGYHDVTPRGVPYGRVFVQETWEAGETVSSVLSHEVVEAVGDPIANTWREDPATGIEYAQELADPVQGDTYPDRHGITLSDFVLPAWFTHGAEGPYSYLGIVDPSTHRLAHPFEIAPAGYGIIRRAGEVRNVFGARYPDEKRDRVGLPGSRTSRR